MCTRCQVHLLKDGPCCLECPLKCIKSFKYAIIGTAACAATAKVLPGEVTVHPPSANTAASTSLYEFIPASASTVLITGTITRPCVRDRHHLRPSVKTRLLSNLLLLARLNFNPGDARTMIRFRIERLVDAQLLLECSHWSMLRGPSVDTCNDSSTYNCLMNVVTSRC